MKELCKAGDDKIRKAGISDREEYIDTLIEESLSIFPNKLIPYVLSYI